MPFALDDLDSNWRAKRSVDWLSRTGNMLTLVNIEGKDCIMATRSFEEAMLLGEDYESRTRIEGQVEAGAIHRFVAM